MIRPDAGSHGRLVKSDRAVHDTVVGDRQRGLTQLFGALDERPDAAGAVEQAVFTMYVQMCNPIVRSFQSSM